MRSGERAALSDIERSKEKDKLLKKGVGLATTAATTAIGATAAARVLPFLSEHIPFDLAIKGINKISPKIGQFLQNGQKKGLDIKEGLDFLRDQFAPKEEKPQEQQQAPEEPGQKMHPLQEFESNYPNLAGALMRTMQNNQSPDKAAAILKNSEAFRKEIKKLEQETGKNFVDYITEIFGQGQGIQQQTQQGQQQDEPLAMTPEMYAQHQADYQRNQGQAQPGQQQQSGDIKNNIMAALDKIMKM